MFRINKQYDINKILDRNVMKTSTEVMDLESVTNDIFKCQSCLHGDVCKIHAEIVTRTIMQDTQNMMNQLKNTFCN